MVAVYEGQWFVAEICQEQSHVPKGYLRVSYSVIKGMNDFTWPTNRPDIMLTVVEDILLRGISVVPLNSRGYFGLQKSDLKRVEALMVVVYFSKYQFFPFFSVFDFLTL